MSSMLAADPPLWSVLAITAYVLCCLLFMAGVGVTAAAEAMAR